jgi:ABC-type proline/glycine betaine transport system permease subunit
VSTLASTTTTAPATPTSTTPSFFVLLLSGLAVMFLGNLLGRYLSKSTHRTVSRKVYFFVTIPIMVVFVLIVFVMGRSLSMVEQYTLFGVYILGFSILGGFVEAPPVPTRSSGPSSRDAKPSDELPHVTTGSDTIEGEGKDITQDSPVDDKTEHHHH